MLLLLLLLLLKYNSVSLKENQTKPNQGTQWRSKKRLAVKRCIVCFSWDRYFSAVLVVEKQQWDVGQSASAALVWWGLLSAPLPVTDKKCCERAREVLLGRCCLFFYTNKSQKQKQRVENARSVSTKNNKDSCVFFLMVADWIFCSRCL